MFNAIGKNPGRQRLQLPGAFRHTFEAKEGRLSQLAVFIYLNLLRAQIRNSFPMLIQRNEGKFDQLGGSTKDRRLLLAEQQRGEQQQRGENSHGAQILPFAGCTY
jgi:hypothetical protein